MEDLVEMFRDGGPFMWVILGCGLVAAAIAADRAVFLYGRAAVNAEAFSATIQKLVMANNIERAVKICNAEPNALLPQVILAGLLHANESEGDIRDAVEEAAVSLSPKVFRRINHLSMLANVATLLGLLGTIQGLIAAFDAVGAETGGARTAALADGISVAMFTTFFGLLVAIPSVVVHGLALSRAEDLADEIESHALKVTNLLVARRRGLSHAP